MKNDKNEIKDILDNIKENKQQTKKFYYNIEEIRTSIKHFDYLLVLRKLRELEPILEDFDKIFSSNLVKK